jgi:tetraacyldisaccharide 4'-kinase
MSAASSIALAPLGAIYGTAMRTRSTLYRLGVLKTLKLNRPVISVGNITTGGTGKTPLVEWLARALSREGLRVCILTRGYGRTNSHARAVVSDGQTILASIGEAGDEPLLLARSLDGRAAIICDADRFSAGEWAERQFNTQVFILDDGFQHLRLARELNIVTIDATNPWGRGHMLPWGRLREPRRGLARADCVVITRADQCPDLDSLKAEVAELNGDRPIFISRMKVRGLRRVKDFHTSETNLTVESIESPLAAFSAIGNPHSFRRQLQGEGLAVAVSQEFSDHHRYTQKDLDALTEQARHAGAKGLVTTAKDAVKLSTLDFELPCYVVEIEIQIADEDGLLTMIRAAVRDQNARLSV